ncbi:hypothetical protein [Fusobacterium sp. PH5-44]|uniref:hypothetical protein n=1 Tax=unclassified Fusobacterium TaxID=2648384 RepID=UPI003D1A27C0
MIKDIIDNKNTKYILENFEKIGIINTLSIFAEVLDRRSYFNLTDNGIINIKNINYAIPLFAFTDDKKYLSQILLELSDIRERTKFKKINRHSNISMDKIKKNFMKTLANGTLEFSKEYGKEIFLRDEKAFFNIISIFSLSGNLKSLKSLMVISFISLVEKFGKKNITDEVLYLVISFLTKYRDNFYDLNKFIEKKQENLDIDILYNDITNNIDLMKSKRGLELLSYLLLIKKSNLENKELYINIVKYEIENLNDSDLLNNYETILVKKLLEIGV